MPFNPVKINENLVPHVKIFNFNFANVSQYSQISNDFDETIQQIFNVLKYVSFQDQMVWPNEHKLNKERLTDLWDSSIDL